MVYYNKVKYQLKSEHAFEAIENVFMKIQAQLWFTAHSYVKYMCTFDFKGDIIVEAANSGKTCGSLTVSTSMKLHTA